METWIKENELTGGPQGVLDAFVLMVNETRAAGQLRAQAMEQIQNLKVLAFEFIEQHELTEEWNEFLLTKEGEKNAVQEQQAEEVPLQEEAESSEEAVETPDEEKE